MAETRIAKLTTQKGLLELATIIKRLIDEAKKLGDVELLFDLEIELDEIEDAIHRAYRVRI
jgi:hypothetical protein